MAKHITLEVDLLGWIRHLWWTPASSLSVQITCVLTVYLQYPTVVKLIIKEHMNCHIPRCINTLCDNVNSFNEVLVWYMYLFYTKNLKGEITEVTEN